MPQTAHYYAGGTLNRASWLRDAVDTINQLFSNPGQSRVVLFHNGHPLCRVHDQDKSRASLIELPPTVITPHLAHLTDQMFRMPQHLKQIDIQQEDARPICVFLGLQDGDQGALPHGKDLLPVSTPLHL